MGQQNYSSDWSNLTTVLGGRQNVSSEEIDLCLAVGGNNTSKEMNLSTWNENCWEAEQEEDDPHYVLRDVIACIIMIVSILGNLTVLTVTIRRIFRLKKASSVHLFLCNLSVADLLVTSILVPAQIGWIRMEYWNAGDIPCRMLGFFKVLGLYPSGFIIVCISIDRYMAICRPFLIKEAVQRAKVMLIVGWIGPAALSLPEALLHHVKRPVLAPHFAYCTDFGFFPSYSSELAYVIMKILVFCGLPFIVICVCYLRILWTLCLRADIRRSSSATDLLGRAKRKAVTLFLLIASVYLICWTPTEVIVIWQVPLWISTLLCM